MQSRRRSPSCSALYEMRRRGSQSHRPLRLRRGQAAEVTAQQERWSRGGDGYGDVYGDSDDGDDVAEWVVGIPGPTLRGASSPGVLAGRIDG